jgi:hypothetical protein
MEDKSKELLPASTTKETILDTVASVSSIAPWVGGVVSSVLSGMSISRKMERVKEVVLNMAEGIKDLEAEISKNYVTTEEFQELFEDTIQKSAKEHNDEKRKAYSAFLINDIKNPTNDTYDEKLRFLRTLEEMQIYHIYMLKAMMLQPDSGPANIVGSIYSTLKKRLPSMPPDRIKDLAEQLTDIKVAKLTNLGVGMTGRRAEELQRYITPYGHRFIRYILYDE